MKKIMSLFVAIVLVAALASTSLAVSRSVTKVGDVETWFAKTAPTWDGVISKGEWGRATKIKASNFQLLGDGVTKTNTADDGTIAVDYYSMWDKNYLYFALDVTDPTYSPYVSASLGKVMADMAGDFFLFFIDPGAVLEKAVDTGKSAAHLCTPLLHCIPFTSEAGKPYEAATFWYEAGYGATGGANYLSQPVSASTPAVAVAKNTDKGYVMEIAMPWKNIIDFAEYITGEEIKIETGLNVKAAIDYWNHENGINTWRACTTENTSFADIIWFGTHNNGINMILKGNPNTADYTAIVAVVAACAAAVVFAASKKH